MHLVFADTRLLFFRRLIKLAVLIVALFWCVGTAQTFLFYHSDHNADRISGFYKEPDHSLDVVIIGASEVYTGYSPVHAYDYSGLTSYAYAYSSNPGSLYLHELKEIMSHQNPQLILVETQGFLYDDNRQMQEAHLRTFSENIPLSCNKLDAIWRYPYEDKLSCLFPFLKYHGNWQLSGAEMRERYCGKVQQRNTFSRLKGISTVTSFDDVVSWQYDMTEELPLVPLEPLGEKYLSEFLDYLADNQLTQVVFIRFPHKVAQTRQHEFFGRENYAEQMIRQRGYQYLDFEEQSDEFGFDPQYDFYDPEHLNIYGQMRLTEAICDILTEEYGLEPQHQTQQNQERWDACIPYEEGFLEIAQELLDQGEKVELFDNAELMCSIEERFCI